MLSTPRRSRTRWRGLLRPKWLAWHAFAVLAAAGMLWLGDWQLHRAAAGNELSWAYTFEWPLFAVLGAVFWAKTLKEELRPPDAADEGAAGQGAGDGGAATAAGTPGLPGAGAPAEGAVAGTDPAGRSPADAGATAYAARLRTEIRGHGRWHGLR
jgi:hypothetical protein